MRQWFTLSNPAMEQAFCDTPLYRVFAELPELSRLPKETRILRFRNPLEKHKLTENSGHRQLIAGPSRLAT